MPDAVAVTNAGLPIAAPHASRSMSTTGRGQVPAVSLLNSSGDSSSNLIRRPVTPTSTGTDVAQCRVERFGHGEVAGDDLDVRWQLRRLGATRRARTGMPVRLSASRQRPVQPAVAPVTSTRMV